MNSNPNRELPHSFEAERALLGTILMNNAAYHRVADYLKPEHFADPMNGKIFESAGNVIKRGQGITAFSLKAYVDSIPGLKDVGGAAYFARLMKESVHDQHADSCGREIVDAALRRGLIAAATEATNRAYSPDASETAAKQIEDHERRLYDLAVGHTDAGFEGFAKVLTGTVQQAEVSHKRQGQLSGVTTGLRSLDALLGGMHKSDLLILAGRPSMGKAQPLDAKVLMRDGSWKNMGDLRLGDDLASIDGAPSRVAGVFPQGKREVFEITLRDGRKTRACGEHLWAIESCKFDGRRVVSTAALAEMLTRERFQGRVSIPLVSGHFGADEGIAIDPWLLGVLIGNGCMTEGHLSVSTADAATLHRVQDVLGVQLKAANASGYDYRIPRGSESSVAQALVAYGLTGKRSEEKFIPAPYMRACRETRLELLRGLLDTDGWVEKHGSVCYGTSSEQLAFDVRDLVRSLGGACTIAPKTPTYTYRDEQRQGLPAFVCNIAHADRGSLLTLTRKRRRCAKDMRFHVPTVVSVKPCGAEETQCIRVTHGSSLYVTDDYIVTHNTALATNIAFNAARAYRSEVGPDGKLVTVDGANVGFFSLEMSSEQLATRIVAESCEISGSRIRKGDLSTKEMDRFITAATELESLPLYIDDTPALSITALRTRARRLQRQHGCDLFVVDYLQLITPDSKRNGFNRVNEVSEITMGLKAMAKELDVPVLALSQLSRNVESREDKRPQLSDLRESGSIEQDADVVMFVYRDEYYLERDKKKNGGPDHLAAMGQGDVLVEKQRHGPIGTVKLRFEARLTKFSDLGT